MKKIKKAIYGLIAIASFVLACGESTDRTDQILWTGSMLLVSGLAAKGLERNMSDEEREDDRV